MTVTFKEAQLTNIGVPHSPLIVSKPVIYPESTPGSHSFRQAKGSADIVDTSNSSSNSNSNGVTTVKEASLDGIEYTDVSLLVNAALDDGDDDLMQPLLMSTEKLSIEVKSPLSLNLTEAERAAALAEITGKVPLGGMTSSATSSSASIQVAGSNSPQDLRIQIEPTLRPPSLSLPKDNAFLSMTNPIVVSAPALTPALSAVVVSLSSMLMSYI